MAVFNNSRCRPLQQVCIIALTPLCHTCLVLLLSAPALVGRTLILTARQVLQLHIPIKLSKHSFTSTNADYWMYRLYNFNWKASAFVGMTYIHRHNTTPHFGLAGGGRSYRAILHGPKRRSFNWGQNLIIACLLSLAKLLCLFYCLLQMWFAYLWYLWFTEHDIAIDRSRQARSQS
jgi:hypothetical protein